MQKIFFMGVSVLMSSIQSKQITGYDKPATDIKNSLIFMAALRKFGHQLHNWVGNVGIYSVFTICVKNGVLLNFWFSLNFTKKLLHQNIH